MGLTDILKWAENSPATKQGRIQYQSRAGGQEYLGIWVAAATQICSPFSSNRQKTRSDYGPMDRPIDGWMDGPT